MMLVRSDRCQHSNRRIQGTGVVRQVNVVRASAPLRQATGPGVDNEVDDAILQGHITDGSFNDPREEHVSVLSTTGTRNTGTRESGPALEGKVDVVDRVLSRGPTNLCRSSIVCREQRHGA